MEKRSIDRSSSWICRTSDGKWYSEGIDGKPIETHVETLRTVHGEMAVGVARRTGKVVSCVLETYHDANADEFVKSGKEGNH